MENNDSKVVSGGQDNDVRKETEQGANPVMAIGIAILISLILSAISLTIFLRSDTRKNLELIQRPTNQATVDPSIDETSPLKAGDLDGIEQAILRDLEPLRTDVDFNPNELTDAALGL